jgi:FtsP/CotA-like multicopper oxidase with cupredoxin domain
MNRRDMLAALGATAVGGVGAILNGRLPQRLFGVPRNGVAQAFNPHVDIELTAAPDTVALLAGDPTSVWRFSATLLKGPAETLQNLPNSYLGPVIRLRRGQRVRIRFRNRLPEPSIVHWHGLDVPEAADGHPRFAIGQGQSYVYEFEVRNRAGTYWYHPHPHHRTGAQVYRGLAGVLIVSDEEEAAAGLPSGPREMVCVLQDRTFTIGNQLVLPDDMMTQRHGFIGQTMLVNGRMQQRFAVDSAAYRLRLLNGSNSRVYSLVWSDGRPITVIGTDGGLLERPVVQRAVTLAPAQRVDLIVDFSDAAIGSTIELRSAPFAGGELDPAGMGMGGRMGRGGGSDARVPMGASLSLMSFEVVRRVQERFAVPERLSTFESTWSALPTLPDRRVSLSFAAGQWQLAGRTFDMLDVASDEIVRAGGSQVWEVTNLSGMMGMPMAHPLHVHGSQFRVLARSRADGAAASIANGRVDAGWMDTVLVLPNETVRLQLHFTRHPGLYLYHCHILEHEDMGMMRNFRVVAA